MIEKTEQDQSTEIEDVAEEISETLQASFDLLLQRREAALAAAFAPLNAEAQSLGTEAASIEEAEHSLEELLPSKARVAQAEHDRLLLAGDREGAAARLAEQKEAENAPETMKARRREIDVRLTAIEAEKRDAARRVFEQWYAELQHVIRASEHGLFISLLDKSRAEMFAFQERHGLVGTLDQPYSFLVKDHHISNLTSPERSQEWVSGQKWYQGRGR